MPALHVRFLTLILQITKQKIQMIRHGAQSTKRDAKSLAFPPTLIIPGSGLIWTVSRKPASPVFSEPALTLVSPAFLQPMHRNTISMKFTRLIFWTATAAIMDIRLQPTSIRKSTSARYPLPVLTGKTATGWKFRQCRSNGNITSMR